MTLTFHVWRILMRILFHFDPMVDGLVKKLSAEFTDNPRVIATGGMSELIAAYTESIQVVDPLLTLTGLYILHEKNS